MNETLSMPRTRASGWAASVAALTLLVVRPYLTGAPFAGVLTMGGISMALLVLSVAGPTTREAGRLHPIGALAIGIGAVSLAGAVSGPALPMVAGFTAGGLLLNTLAAVAEEAFFRRFLYGKLARWGPIVAIGTTTGLFAAVHVPAYGLAAFPVDLGAGLLLGWQRWASGTWTVPAATHVWANLLVMAR